MATTSKLALVRVHCPALSVVKEVFIAKLVVLLLKIMIIVLVAQNVNLSRRCDCTIISM